MIITSLDDVEKKNNTDGYGMKIRTDGDASLESVFYFFFLL